VIERGVKPLPSGIDQSTQLAHSATGVALGMQTCRELEAGWLAEISFRRDIATGYRILKTQAKDVCTWSLRW